MTTYPIPSNERERLEELFNYQILDTPVEDEFSDIINIVAKTFNVPAAAITFLDTDRQWIKAEHGLGFCELDRGVSICNYVILQSDVFEVNDLQQDDRFSNFPYVAGTPNYRFYAGAPLITRKGYHIGSLCIVDDKVRMLCGEERKMMAAFARNIITQLELRLQNLSLQQENDTQKRISAALSHDVRGPLANVKLILQLQEEEMGTCEMESKELNKMLLQGVDNTMDILNNMIQWGKLQVNGSTTATSFNLRILADKALNEVYDMNSTKFNTLVNAIPENTLVQAEYEGIRFVLRNLLTNAGKFTHQGCITLSCEENSEGKMMMMVRDTGLGMSPETTARLNRSQKIMHSNGTHHEKGNGLGLSLVQEYLAKNNKELFFQSTMGVGTVVSFEV